MANRGKKAATRKQRKLSRKKGAAGKKAAITKVLNAAKQRAAGKRSAVAKALTAAQRRAAAKWAWVTRQLKTKRA